MSTTLKATCPEDILAAVPVVLGFIPEDSLVMLTFGAPEQFHARIDLPRTPQEAEDCVEAVLRPAAAHGVVSVLFVQYAAEALPARRLAERLALRFSSAGIKVIGSFRAHGGRWFAAVPRPEVPAEGVAYQIDDHAFRARAVFDGRVTLPSRADVVARVVADPALVAETQESLADAAPLNLSGAVGLLARSLPRGRIADTGDLASLLLALRDPIISEQAAIGVRREDAEPHVALWSDVVRRCPDRLAGNPAALLALMAWLCGDGALAWCAVERSVSADPDNELAALVGRLLDEAVPPSRWGDGEVTHGQVPAPGG